MVLNNNGSFVKAGVSQQGRNHLHLAQSAPGPTWAKLEFLKGDLEWRYGNVSFRLQLNLSQKGVG